MKKILLLLCLFSCITAQAFDEEVLVEENNIQTRINNMGTHILNSNKLDKRVIFAYDEADRNSILKNTDALTKRQVVIFASAYKNIETDDELAAYISREIPAAIRSYDGLGNGWLSSVKIKAAPKKYELVFDKLAVDYMVQAGYNPLGLITFIQKTCPQTRQDKISDKNLTSKRLAHIYERIYTQYPSFLKNNTYLDNKYYQNFLLTSQENRKLFLDKVRSGDMKKKVKYE